MGRQKYLVVCVAAMVLAGSVNAQAESLWDLAKANRGVSVSRCARSGNGRGVYPMGQEQRAQEEAL